MMSQTALSCELKWSNQLQRLICTDKIISFNEFNNESHRHGNGKELIIEYDNFRSPVGECFLAKNQFGICKLAFFDTEFEETLIEKELQDEWQHARLLKDNTKIRPQAEIIFSPKKNWQEPLQLFLKGTQFQLKVWKTLISLAGYDLVSYQAVAATILKPKAVRAVASAIANNKIAYLVPCHRVIRKNGDIGQYRWGERRKKELIAWEEKVLTE